MGKTELFSQWLQGALVIADQGKSTGTRFWVHSGTGVDAAGYGRSPDAPWASIAYAFSGDVPLPNKGDIIYVMPGHAESVIAAAGIVMDIAGVSVIGLGKGADRPTISIGAPATVGCDINISANGIHLENLLFLAAVDGLTNPLHITGADVVIKDCEWRDATDVEAEHVILTTAAAARLVIDGFFHNGYLSGNACHASIQLAANGPCLIQNSRFQGVASVAFVNVVTAVTDLIVRNCTFRNVGTALTKNVVDTATGSTWAAIGCYDEVGSYGFSGGDGAAVASDDPSSIMAQANKLDAATLNVSPTAGSLARFIASGGTALGTPLGASKSIIDALGTNGAAVADSAVSVLGAIGANNADNAMDSSTVTPNRDGSVLERLEDLRVVMAERCIEKADGNVLNGTDDLFVITGGPVRAQLIGILSTSIGGAANGTLQITTTVPAATVSLSTTVAIGALVAGDSIRFVGATGVLTPTTGGAKIIDPVTVEDCWFLMPVGTVKFLGSAAQTGVIHWYLRFIALSQSSVVAAAA